MAQKLCNVCTTRRADREYNGLCEPCFTEGGWENAHSDEGHSKTNTDPNCWICRPEINRAQATYVKQERKGHHSPRRPQINHKACGHAQTPLARRTCRKAYWAAQAETAAVAPEPVALTAQYTGQVTWTSARGRTMLGTIAADLGTGRVSVKTVNGRLVQVAFASLQMV